MFKTMSQEIKLYEFIKSGGQYGYTAAEIQEHFNFQIQNFRARISDNRLHGRRIECDKSVWPNRFYVPQPEQLKLEVA